MQERRVERSQVVEPPAARLIAKCRCGILIGWVDVERSLPVEPLNRSCGRVSDIEGIFNHAGQFEPGPAVCHVIDAPDVAELRSDLEPGTAIVEYFLTARALYVFESARQLTSSSVPSQTMTWTNPTDFARSLAVDSCRNRLYLSIRGTGSGAQMFVFDNAAALTGALDLTTASQAQMDSPDHQIMSTVLDSIGDLYFWKDSATAVRIVTAPQNLSGPVAVTPDKTISGVVASGYGLDVLGY